MVVGGIVQAVLHETAEEPKSVAGQHSESIRREVAESVGKRSRETAEHSQAPRAAEVPDAELSASFEFHNTRAGYKDSFYVLGEVQNTSPVEIRKPEIVIVLLDAGGKEVGRDNGFALAESLKPGEKSYVSAIVSDPPPHDRLQFEVIARKASFILPQARGLEVTANEPVAERGLIKFSGEVKNGGERAAKFVNVRALAFDATDRLMGVFSTYLKADGLAPGESATFSLNGVGLDPAPSRYEYMVRGRPAP
jgi:hypothetical protein